MYDWSHFRLNNFQDYINKTSPEPSLPEANFLRSVIQGVLNKVYTYILLNFEYDLQNCHEDNVECGILDYHLVDCRMNTMLTVEIGLLNVDCGL